MRCLIFEIILVHRCVTSNTSALNKITMPLFQRTFYTLFAFVSSLCVCYGYYSHYKRQPKFISCSLREGWVAPMVTSAAIAVAFQLYDQARAFQTSLLRHDIDYMEVEKFLTCAIGRSFGICITFAISMKESVMIHQLGVVIMGFAELGSYIHFENLRTRIEQEQKDIAPLFHKFYATYYLQAICNFHFF